MDTKNEKRWALLEKVAIAAEPVSRSRLAAMLVYKNDVIAVGYNKRKSHPLAKRFRKHDEAIYLHAEIMTLNRANKCLTPEQLSKSELYVLRIKKSECGKTIWGLAKPCEGCMEAIKHFKIKKVHYTNNATVDHQSYTTMIFS